MQRQSRHRTTAACRVTANGLEIRFSQDGSCIHSSVPIIRPKTAPLQSSSSKIFGKRLSDVIFAGRFGPSRACSRRAWNFSDFHQRAIDPLVAWIGRLSVGIEPVIFCGLASRVDKLFAEEKRTGFEESNDPGEAALAPVLDRAQCGRSQGGGLRPSSGRQFFAASG